MVTDTHTWLPTELSRRQRASCMHASTSTHWSICVMNPGLLGERQELGRREQAVLGLLPADQRLDSHRPRLYLIRVRE